MQLGIAIVKRCAFRDSVQEFSNVYHYEVLVPPNAAECLLRIDELVTLEKTWHSANVTFVEGRCWSSGGTIAQNQMLAQKLLTGVGSQSADTTLDRERAFLIQWPAGVDSRGKPVTLKKWYHTCGSHPAVAISSAIKEGISGFTDANRTAIAAVHEAVRDIGLLNEYNLVAESGRETTGAAVAHKYLEHHQFGDQWRG